MFATISFRIKSPPRKAVLLTTLYCAIAGGLSELVNALDIHWDLGFYSPSVLFSIAVLVAFRKSGTMTIARMILMPLVMFGIFYGAFGLVASSSDLFSTNNLPVMRKIWDGLVWSLPGMATIVAVAVLLKIRIRILNILIGGICSLAGFVISLTIASYSDTWFSVGPIFILWQTLVGVALGLINVKSLK